MTEQNQVADNATVEQTEDNQDVFKQTNVFEEISQATGKNLDSPEAVIKKIKSSDEFIETLKAEQAEQRKLIDALLEKTEQSENAKSVLEQLKQNKNKDVPPAQGFDKESASKIIDELLSSKEKAKLTESNIKEFSELARKNFGSDVATKLATKAKEVGMSVDRIKELASESPSAAARLLGIDIKQPIQSGSVTQSDVVNVDNPQGKTGLAKFKEECIAKGIKLGTPKYYQLLVERQKEIF